MEQIIRTLLASMALFDFVGADIRTILFTERLGPRDFGALASRAPLDLTPAASATLPQGWYYYGCWTYVAGG